MTDRGDDPFVLLGLTASATVVDVQAARRRLAKLVHPDVGGDADAMRRVNEAADAALAQLGAVVGGPRPPRRDERTDDTRAPGANWSTVASDHPSFTVEALPAEAFEALAVVATWFGEIVTDDPPYLLEVVMEPPTGCWCRLDLQPEAGSSSVSISIAPVERVVFPSVDTVRDRWIAALNELDWDRMDLVQRPS